MKQKPPERDRINFFLLKSEKLALQAEAKRRGMTCSELLRDMVRRELMKPIYELTSSTR